MDLTDILLELMTGDEIRWLSRLRPFVVVFLYCVLPGVFFPLLGWYVHHETAPFLHEFRQWAKTLPTQFHTPR